MNSLPDLAAVDWKQSWLAPWEHMGRAVGARCAGGTALVDALNQEARNSTGGCPVQFVRQSALPATLAYEEFIFSEKTVPCRDNLHDFFNGLAWLVFPDIKKRLNALQFEQIALHGVGAIRGPVRDALTVFDENAALWTGPDAMWQALQNHDWHTLLTEHRDAWHTSTHLVLFGHALLEKLVHPRKALVAHCLRHTEAADTIAGLDHAVANTLNAALFAKKPLQPLPILGVPGWWAANTEADFYNDPSVFRPKRN